MGAWAPGKRLVTTTAAHSFFFVCSLVFLCRSSIQFIIQHPALGPSTPSSLCKANPCEELGNDLINPLWVDGLLFTSSVVEQVWDQGQDSWQGRECRMHTGLVCTH
ncbi:hypothetical protein BX600DRAFT_464665 [Xylariales sp. PMI_506]|nr:hypothetical protein BX600DRAFT_464665 [Xylariales sp. PMI_506]